MRSPLQFAVVREDPRLEDRLLDRLGDKPKHFFGVTAAGCTLLHLAARRDLARAVGADVDPRQTAWARLRLVAAKQLSRRDYCRVTGISHIEPAVREGLFQKIAQALPPEDRAFFKAEREFFAGGAFDDGTFERLFACWREFVERFVVAREQVSRLFEEGERAVADVLIGSRLWSSSFDMFFHHNLLAALFGPDAVQHAPPGSYPRYFQSRFEWALKQPSAPQNPYLSHVLRGRYGALDGGKALPDYLLPERYEQLAESRTSISCVTGTIPEALAAHPGPYDLIELSNILDWSSDAASDALAQPVLDHLAPGGFLLVRQLNNVRPLPQLWMKSLDFDPALERELHAADRAFFYSAIRVGRRR